MRPNKLSRAQIISHCTVVFKQHGYAGTSMQMLAESCGLTKGAFYYYYPNKEQLLVDILKDIHRFLKTKMLDVSADKSRDVLQRFEFMHQQTVQYFTIGGAGCLMAIISIEAIHSLPDAKMLIQDFFADWQQAMYQLFIERYREDQANILARQSIADYEGAILMYRFSEDDFYIDYVKQRIEKLFG